MPRWLHPFLCACLFFLFAGSSQLCAQTAFEPAHRAAIELARQGKYDAALDELQELQRSRPEDKTVAYDRLAVLSWAGRTSEALELADKIDPEEAPAYVLEALAASYRHQRRYAEAEETYRLALQRFPDHPDFRAGLSLTLADARRPREALAQLEADSSQMPEPLPLLFARGYALERSGNRFDALRTYEALLQRQPDHRDARRRLGLVLADLGAPFLAAQMVVDEPGLLDNEEYLRIRADQAALAVRWRRLGGRQSGAGDRLRSLLNSESGATRRRALADLVVLNRDRGEMATAVEQYRQLARQTDEPPLHASAAAADALSASGCPEEAERLYRHVLEKRPDDFAMRLGLFYALADQGKFDIALPWIDRVVAAEPRLLRSGDTNPLRLRAQIAAGLGRLFADDAPEAEHRFAHLLQQAPGNADLWRELGSAESARGWPRRAQQTYRRGLAVEPLHTGLNIGLADSHLDLGEFPQAEETLQRLCLREPRHAGVQRLARRWQLHEMRELYLEVSGGRSSGVEFGSREIHLAATVLSRPIRDHFRTFVGYSRAEADFPEGEEVLHRYRAGVRYRARNVAAEAEANFNANGRSETGLSLSGTWEPDDHWAFPAQIEIFSADTPLRAIRNGVHADGASLGVRWRGSNRRSWNLSLQRLDFTDGNDRHSAYSALRQRLFTRPGLFLDGELEAYASDNTRSDVAYFSPREDFSAGFSLSLHHQICRRGDRAFAHRLTVSSGRYWQRGFDPGTTAAVRYEHLVEASDRLYIGYGVERSRRIYDGDPDYASTAHLELSWRF